MHAHLPLHPGWPVFLFPFSFSLFSLFRAAHTRAHTEKGSTGMTTEGGTVKFKVPPTVSAVCKHELTGYPPTAVLWLAGELKLAETKGLHHRPTIRAGQREWEVKIETDKRKRTSPTVKAGKTTILNLGRFFFEFFFLGATMTAISFLHIYIME